MEPLFGVVGGRFTPFYAMFHSRHCLGYPLGLIKNYIKPEDTRYPIPLTPIPQPPQPLPFTNESVPPLVLQISLVLYFFEHQAVSGCHFGYINPSQEEAHKA